MTPRTWIAALLLVLPLPGLGAFDLGFLTDSKTLEFAGRTVETLTKANQELSPEQQHYLGRAFSATVFLSRPPLNAPLANRYLNQIGQALVLAADQPATFGGYRFLIVDSPEINAFAAPGGFVLVTKGLVQMTRTEAELAAVLAHEIGHVALDHGVKAIQKNRLTGAWVGIGADAAKTYGPEEVRSMTEAFEGSVADLTKTIIDKGYSRETEFEADARAVTVLRRAGYPPRALLSMLQELRAGPQASGPGFAKTHPSAQDRIAKVQKLVSGDGEAAPSPVQQDRFLAALAGL